MSAARGEGTALEARNRRLLLALIAFGLGVAVFTVAYVTWFHH